MNDAATIKRICDSQRLSLATAESVTVGHIQATIGAVSGSSTFFRGGATAYDIDAKVSLLGVQREHAEAVNCVSPQVAKEMAEGATRVFDADLGVATTGYAEPYEGSAPFVFYAIWDRAEGESNPVRAGKIELPDADRLSTQRHFASSVVHELTAYLVTRWERER